MYLMQKELKSYIKFCCSNGDVNYSKTVYCCCIGSWKKVGSIVMLAMKCGKKKLAMQNSYLSRDQHPPVSLTLPRSSQSM